MDSAIEHTRYIALLRGINVGGHKKIPMADLRTLFESLGFANSKTLLASGNIAWDAEPTDTATMQATIARGIAATFGFAVDVIVLPRRQVEHLVTNDPFASIETTAATRLSVTFLAEPPTTTLDLPYHAPGLDFTILRVTDTAICSVLTLSATAKTPDAMQVLEALFGKRITTRTWETVRKLARL